MFCKKCGSQLLNHQMHHELFLCPKCNTHYRYDNNLKAMVEFTQNNFTNQNNHSANVVAPPTPQYKQNANVQPPVVNNAQQSPRTNAPAPMQSNAKKAVGNQTEYKFFSRRFLIPFAVVILLAIVFGCINFPEALRAIRGEDFIGFLFLVAFLVILPLQLFTIIYSRRNLKAVEAKLKNTYISNNDIMILKNIGTYRYNAYFILKAALYGVVSFFQPQGKGVFQIKLNKTEQTYELCKKDPEINAVVLAMKSIGNNTTIAKVIENLNKEPQLDSDGGKELKAVMVKNQNLNKLLSAISVYILYYLGVSKMTMGFVNDKPVGFLIGCLLLAFPLLLWFSHLVISALIKSPYDKLTEKIAAQNTTVINNYQQIVYNALTNDNKTQREIFDILKAYPFYVSHITTSVNEDNGTQTNIFAAITMVETAVMVRNASKSSSSSGCRGCSSCGGGCGGGCSGCGGCGD